MRKILPDMAKSKKCRPTIQAKAESAKSQMWLEVLSSELPAEFAWQTVTHVLRFVSESVSVSVNVSVTVCLH